jgi:hypothetical protein
MQGWRPELDVGGWAGNAPVGLLLGVAVGAVASASVDPVLLQTQPLFSAVLHTSLLQNLHSEGIYI